MSTQNTPSNSAVLPKGRLLVTGAAGALGRVLREALVQDVGPNREWAQLRVSDRAPLSDARPHEEVVICDLADREAMERLLVGVDAVVHLGGQSVETPFEGICEANIKGVFNLYEAARLAGCKRVVMASSNHVTGCYDQGEFVSPEMPARPDGYYGVSKLFAEGMASMYFDRYGIETVSLRLGSVIPKAEDRRGLSTWLSYPDFFRLTHASLRAKNVGNTTVYGVSANPHKWWSESGWDKIGYVPQDSAEPLRAEIEHKVFPEGSMMAKKQGGLFLDLGPFPRTGS
jgi:uronate dehydrogenase